MLCRYMEVVWLAGGRLNKRKVVSLLSLCMWGEISIFIISAKISGCGYPGTARLKLAERM